MFADAFRFNFLSLPGCTRRGSQRPARPVRFLASLLLLALCFGIAGAEPMAPETAIFVDSGQNLASNNSSAVALGDSDGDGDLDAFVANFSGPSVIFVNQGGAQGGMEGIYALGGQTFGTGSALDVDLADMDGDNDLDVLFTLDSFGSTLQVWINQGGAQGGNEGEFLANGQSIGDDLQDAAAIGPLDGNSSVDIWVGRAVGRADKVWNNDGSGQFADSGQTLGAESATDVDLGDVDGDGDLDSFVTNGSVDRLWINQGGNQGGSAGTFLDSGQSLGGILNLAVVLADVDGDMDPDAVVAGIITNTLYVNQGGAQGGEPGIFVNEGEDIGQISSRSIAAADLDNDGDIDIFVGNNGADEVYINQGGVQGGTEGSFTSNGQNLGGSTSEGVALGDVDGDGDVDAFVAHWDGPNLVWLNTHSDASPPLNPAGWQYQLVDSRGIAGLGTALVLDVAGHPHIGYLVRTPTPAGNEYEVFYAHWDGVRWLTQPVVRLLEVFPGNIHIGIALTSAGEPRLAFHGRQSDSLDLLYASPAPIGWQVETVDTAVKTEQVKQAVDLVLDAADRPHISYARGVIDNTLHYATHDGVNWQLEMVDPGPFSVGTHNAIAVDGLGRPHIAYWRDDGEDLHYAVRVDGSWQTEIVHADDVEGFVDIVIDGLNRPHISYVVGFFYEIRHARKDGANWSLSTVAENGVSEVFNTQTTIGVDSANRPRVAFGVEFGVGTNYQLRYAAWDGAAWQEETLDGGAGQYASMAIAGDSVHIAYHDGKYHDLRYLSWDTRWQTQQQAAGQQTRAASLALIDRAPLLGFHNETTGQVWASRWESGGWVNAPVGFVSAPVGATASAVVQSRPYVAYHNADTGAVEFAGWDGSAWQTSVIDSGNVGAALDMAFLGISPQANLAYWDATLRRIKLARFTVTAPNPVISINSAGPALNVASGFPAVVVLPAGDVGVSYYDAGSGNLRYAVWDSATTGWSDALVDGALTDAGRYNDAALDADTGRPVIAYHDATLEAIRYARWNGSAWDLETAVANVTAVSDLALDLGFNSASRARIAYIDTVSDEVRLAILNDGIWSRERAAAAGQFVDLGAVADSRIHMAVASGSGLSYIARMATLDVSVQPFVPPQPPSSYNPMDACQAVLDLFTGAFGSVTLWQAQLPENSHRLSDEAIFQGMAGMFALSAGGQHYINLYSQHGTEMGRLALADPALLWDGYGTLQNFMPGLEALVTGRGEEVIVTQEMVDDALDVWQRLAAAAGPELAGVINGELAQSNNLQDFVDLSFADWATAIGVYSHTVYLPVVSR